MRTTAVVLLLLGCLVWQSIATADEWLPPKPETYYSTNRQWRLTVVPRAIESPLVYFKDKVSGRSNPGAPPRDPESHARGFLEHLHGPIWETVWNRALVNEVSPVTASVSNRGSVATFDNWHSLGYGNDVVVLYDNHGQRVRSLSLGDLLPATYIVALPHSVSSIWWGGDHHFSSDGSQLILRVLVPSGLASGSNEKSRNYINVAIDSTTGRVIPPHGSAWNRAVDAAAGVDAEQSAAEAAEIAYHNSPLRPPDTYNVTPWYKYLVEAFYRLDPGRNEGYPATKVLPRRSDPDYKLLYGYLKDAIVHPINDTGAIMLASPDQASLVRVLDAITKKMPPDRLSKARIYVTVTPTLRDNAAKAIARTGATFIPLDVTKAIPVPPRPAASNGGRP